MDDFWEINKLRSKVNYHPRSISKYIKVYTCLLVLGTSCNCVSGTKAPLPLWTWECANEKCSPTKAEEMSKIQSLETCNMLCSSMQIWPQPTGTISLSTTAVPVRADTFQLHTISAPSKVVHEHLQDAFRIFREDLSIIEKNARGFEEWRSVSIRLVVNSSHDPRLLIDTDESYTLSVQPVPGQTLALQADITAPSFCGARHGLETLLQLVWLDSYMGSLLILEAIKIEDAPRFAYRGLLIDTAHHYVPIPELMQNIDAMAANKLNTFHWHMSNSQAFSLHTNSLTQLTLFGNYFPGNVYRAEEVRMIARRARLRGIRILIEIDTPAHVGNAWSFGPTVGLGSLVLCLDDEPWEKYCHEPPCGQLNPNNKNIYDILTRLYKEIIQLTGVDDIFHLGGDDISEACWLKYFNTEFQAGDLWSKYTTTILSRLEYDNHKMPNKTIFWSSMFSNQFDTSAKKYTDNIVIQIRDDTWPLKLNNLRTIMSYEDPWDLNTGHGEWYQENDGAFYNSWQRIYEHRPWAMNKPGTVIGGEATVWSTVMGEKTLIPRVWPRAAALAERLWTDRPDGPTKLVQARLDVHRSRLVSRGIQASPLWSMWCTHNTFTCG